MKASGALPLGLGLASLLERSGSPPASGDGRQNVLIVVFDAWSAYHLALHGYPRETMPNLARRLDRAIVYHRHYAPSDFTTPGTASLLTGTMPWTHRAFRLHDHVALNLESSNLFAAFQRHHRIAYTHNPAANTLLEQFRGHLDELVPLGSLLLTENPIVQTLFRRDLELADVAWARAMAHDLEGGAYSLFLSGPYDRLLRRSLVGPESGYPLGLPSLDTGQKFRLEDAIDWLLGALARMPQPYAGYFHFLPPHDPSAPPAEFHRYFAMDGYHPVPKPPDVFAEKLSPPSQLAIRQYDEFILYVDREFERLMNYLEATGALENTWVVLTSDHGELFERGVRGHSTPILYEPLLRIPLVIFEPGRASRTDIHSATSAIDILPTLLHVTGQPPADWAEGQILPPFAVAQPGRPLYAVHTRRSTPTQPFVNATAVLINDRYKLLYFFGYKELGEGVERIELYDVLSDREELHNLFPGQRELGLQQLDILKAKLAEVNQPYL